MANLFGTSGIRGIYGQEINEELARSLGAALGLWKKSVVVGRDHRASSESLLSAFVKGAKSAGASVTSAGLATSPTCAFAAKDFGAGVTVTASHNPPEYNGFKFWDPDGSGFSSGQQRELEVRLGKAEECGGGKLKERSFARPHVESILKLVKPSSLKVVVDCNHGTTGLVTPSLLSGMGCEVVTLHKKPHPDYVPEPYDDSRIGDWNRVAGIGELIETVQQSDADLGVVHDGDGDRLFAVARGGRLVTGDELLALFVSQTKGDVVTVVDGSMVVDRVAKGEVHKVAVGDVAVSQAVKERDAALGGEACSGTFVFPEHNLAPDGPMAAAKLVELAGRIDLLEFLEGLPKFPIHRESVPCPTGMKKVVMEGVREEAEKLGAERVVKTDGVRCEFENGWFLIRPSGTSPYVRITVEAEDEKRLAELLSIAQGLAKG